MEINVRKLTKDDANRYISYLEKAYNTDRDNLWVEFINREEILKRFKDDFYQKTNSLVALSGEDIVGRLEYHFYGCLQDGYRMAYIDWVYTLKEYRRQGVGKKLFEAFEGQCKENDIDEYFLIRATSKEAKGFYDGFDGVENELEPILRKTMK